MTSQHTSLKMFTIRILLQNTHIHSQCVKELTSKWYESQAPCKCIYDHTDTYTQNCGKWLGPDHPSDEAAPFRTTVKTTKKQLKNTLCNCYFNKPCDLIYKAQRGRLPRAILKLDSPRSKCACHSRTWDYCPALVPQLWMKTKVGFWIAKTRYKI